MGASALSALFADFLLGEPPAAIHPTVWMGRWIAAGRSRRTSRTPLASSIEGALLIAGGVAIAGGLAMLVDSVLTRSPARSVLTGLALKPALSLAPLITAAGEVQSALERNNLPEARRLLGWHLVSRDTRGLTAPEVAGAAIESVAENLGDSVIAPLLAFRLGGLSAAYAYRMINTADAMLGYHTTELEWFGKPAARVDDVVNIAPARIAAALICAAAPICGGSARAAVSTAFREAGRTSSPNAGWPMAAMAGALGVHLSKRNNYSLNEQGRAARPADVGRACRIVLAASIAAAVAVDLS